MKQKPASKARKLTRKQQLFIGEYQIDFNGTKAAIRAGYSPKRASEIAYQLLQIPTVRQALDRSIEERLWKIGVHAERTLTEVARLAFSDIRDLYREDGSLKHPSEWDDKIAAAVAGLEVFEEFEGKGKDRRLIGHTKKARVFDKTKALEMLGKHLRLFQDGDKKIDVDTHANQRMTNLELSAKIIYLLKMAVERRKELERKQSV